MITAKDELSHIADCVSEQEAVVYLAGPELLAACRKARLALAPLVGRYDAELLPVLEILNGAIAQAEGRAGEGGDA